MTLGGAHMRWTPEFVDDRRTAIEVQFPALLSWDYEHQDEPLVRLYDKAKRAQWNAASDIDWRIDADVLQYEGLPAAA